MRQPSAVSTHLSARAGRPAKERTTCISWTRCESLVKVCNWEQVLNGGCRHAAPSQQQYLPACAFNHLLPACGLKAARTHFDPMHRCARAGRFVSVGPYLLFVLTRSGGQALGADCLFHTLQASLRGVLVFPGWAGRCWTASCFAATMAFSCTFTHARRQHSRRDSSFKVGARPYVY